jgi:hypothetical protein
MSAADGTRGLGDEPEGPSTEGVIEVSQPATDGAHRFDPIVAALAQVIRERHVQEQQARDRRLGLRVMPTQGGWRS